MPNPAEISTDLIGFTDHGHDFTMVCYPLRVRMNKEAAKPSGESLEIGRRQALSSKEQHLVVQERAMDLRDYLFAQLSREAHSRPRSPRRARRQRDSP